MKKQFITLSKKCYMSIYGDQPIPLNLEENNSHPEKNEDLNGYWEIYRSLTCESIIEAITNNDIKELSPPQVLFMLEFHLAAKDNSICLTYTPHRFYHRYARNPNEADKTYSSQRFAEILSEPQHKNAKPIYLCHIEAGKAHAFAAYRIDSTGWALLDSLIKTPKYVAQEELFTLHPNAGRASVLCLQDFSRNTQTL